MSRVLNLKRVNCCKRIRETELSRRKLTAKIQELIERERKITFSSLTLGKTIEEGRKVYQSESGVVLSEKSRWVERAQFLKVQSDEQLRKINADIAKVKKYQNEITLKIVKLNEELTEITSRVKDVLRKDRLEIADLEENESIELTYLRRA